MSVEKRSLDSKNRVWIYTGPSLSVEDATKIAPYANVMPPAKRGDLVLDKDIQLPEVIVFIDGAFLNTLTVSPRELIDLMKLGIKIVGASSLGAIRAVELENYGMIGVGRVFQMFKDREIYADDEVAMGMDPQTGKALSEPLVHFRVLTDEAVKKGIIDKIDEQNLLMKMKELYFPYRNISIFLKYASSNLSPKKLQSLKNLIENFEFRIKKTDAIEAIYRAKEMMEM